MLRVVVERLELSFSMIGNLPEKESIPLRFSFKVKSIENTIRSMHYHGYLNNWRADYAVDERGIVPIAKKPVSKVYLLPAAAEDIMIPEIVDRAKNHPCKQVYTDAEVSEPFHLALLFFPG